MLANVGPPDSNELAHDWAHCGVTGSANMMICRPTNLLPQACFIFCKTRLWLIIRFFCFTCFYVFLCVFTCFYVFFTCLHVSLNISMCFHCIFACHRLSRV